MKKIIVLVTILFVPFNVFSADAFPGLEAGRYTFAGSYPADLDIARVCAVRVDNDVELKCTNIPVTQVDIDANSASVTAPAPDGRKYTVTPKSPTGKVALIQDVTITNTGTNLRVKIVVFDRNGNSSTSDNVAIVDFTPPAKSVVLTVTPS